MIFKLYGVFNTLLPVCRGAPRFASVLPCQDKSLVEIIVVDAGCKDNTMAEVASMKLGVKIRYTLYNYCVGRIYTSRSANC